MYKQYTLNGILYVKSNNIPIYPMRVDKIWTSVYVICEHNVFFSFFGVNTLNNNIPFSQNNTTKAKSFSKKQIICYWFFCRVWIEKLLYWLLIPFY